MKLKAHTCRCGALWLALLLIVAPLLAQTDKQDKEEQERLRIAYYVPVVPKGNAEKAMTAYHKWRHSNARWPLRPHPRLRHG